MDVQHYNKLIAAAVGLVVLLAARYGLDLSGQAAVIVDTIVSVLTAFGVYQLPNKEAQL